MGTEGSLRIAKNGDLLSDTVPFSKRYGRITVDGDVIDFPQINRKFRLRAIDLIIDQMKEEREDK